MYFGDDKSPKAFKTSLHYLNHWWEMLLLRTSFDQLRQMI